MRIDEESHEIISYEDDFCPYCDGELYDDYDFCTHCGEYVGILAEENSNEMILQFTRNCPECNAENDVSNRYCTSCGYKFITSIDIVYE